MLSGPISSFLHSMDKQLNVRSPSGHHSLPSIKADMEVILKCLSKNEVFTRKPKRCHNNFKTFSNNPFKSRLKNPKGLHTCLERNLHSIQENKISTLLMKKSYTSYTEQFLNISDTLPHSKHFSSKSSSDSI